jgi:hypothetical protein
MSYRKLLEIGRSQTNRTVGNDLETDDKVTLAELHALNRYVYTYYSTNAGDKTYTLEFFFPKEKVGRLLRELDKTEYWYLCHTGNIDIVTRVDTRKNKNNDTFEYVQTVSENELSRFGHKWRIRSVIDNIDNIGKQYKISMDQYTYFLNDEFIEEEKREDIEEKIENALEEIDKREDLDIDGLKHKLYSILIEDPVVGRTTLYADILPIVKRVFGTNGSRRSRRKSAKSESPVRHRHSRLTRRANSI